MLRRYGSLFFMEDDHWYVRRLVNALLTGEILSVPERSVVIQALSRLVLLDVSAVWIKLVETSNSVLVTPPRRTLIHVGAFSELRVEHRKTMCPVDPRATQYRASSRVVSCGVPSRVVHLLVPSRRVLL